MLVDKLNALLTLRHFTLDAKYIPSPLLSLPLFPSSVFRTPYVFKGEKGFFFFNFCSVSEGLVHHGSKAW